MTYASSNTDIATVDKNTGKITCHQLGSVIITATKAASIKYKSSVTTYTLTIIKIIKGNGTMLTFLKKEDGTPVFNGLEAEITKPCFYTKTFIPYLNKKEVKDDKRDIIYTSSDPSVATVDENTGSVMCHKKGEVTITATKAENQKYKASTAIYHLKFNDFLNLNKINENYKNNNNHTENKKELEKYLTYYPHDSRAKLMLNMAKFYLSYSNDARANILENEKNIQANPNNADLWYMRTFYLNSGTTIKQQHAAWNYRLYTCYWNRRPRFCNRSESQKNRAFHYAKIYFPIIEKQFEAFNKARELNPKYTRGKFETEYNKTRILYYRWKDRIKWFEGI